MKKIWAEHVLPHAKMIMIAGASAVLLAGGTASGLVLTASHPSASNCKSAMNAQYQRALSSGEQGTEPAACKGLPAAELRKLVPQVITLPTGNQAACSGWKSIRSYLLSVQTVDATVVSKVTSDISSAELLATGQLQSDLSDLGNLIVNGTPAQAETALSAVDSDCGL